METTRTPTPHLQTRFAAADAELIAVIDDVAAEAWENPSPCDGWTARDVLGHLIDAQRDFLIGKDLDPGAAPDVATDPAAAWRAHRTAVDQLIADEEVMATRFDGHFGPTTIGETFARFYVFDMIAHRWDLARATGQEATFRDDELDEMEAAVEGFGPALRSPGICGPAVDVPADADRQTKLLATLGRRA